MKRKQKTPQDKPRSPLKFCGRCIFRLLLVCVLLIAGTLAWLTLFGLPRSLLDDLRVRAARDGVYFDADRICLDFGRGIVGEGWRWFLHEDDIAPLVEAEEVVLELSFLDLFDEEKRIQGLSFSRARLLADIGKLAGQTSRNLTIRGLNGRLTVEPGRIQLRSLEAQFCNFAVKGQGEIIQRKRKPRSTPAPKPPPSEPEVKKGINLEGMQSGLKEICKVITELETVNFGKPATAEFFFRVDENDEANTQVTLNAQSNGACWIRGKAYDDVVLELKMENQEVHVVRYQMLQQARKLEVSATLRLEDDRVDAKIYSDLEADCLFSLMPDGMKNFFDRQGYACSGNMEIDLLFDDAPGKHMSDSVSGWISFDQATYKKMPIQRMRFYLDRKAPMMVADHIDAVFGEGEDAGTLSGRYERNDETEVYTGTFKSAFMPRVLLPVVSKAVGRTLTFADFKGANPLVDIHLSGSDKDAKAFQSEVKLSSSDAVYKNITFETLDLHASYSNAVLHIDHLALQRPEGTVTGRVYQLYEEGLAYLDLESTIDPAALAQVIGPSAVKLVQPVKFIGNSKLSVHGMVDVEHGRRHSMHGRLHVSDAWFKKYHIRAAEFYWTATSNIFTVADFQGEVSGGDLGGFFQITDLNNRTSQMFHLRVEAKNVDMNQVALKDERVQDKPYSGRLSGNLMLSGLLNDNGNESYAGNGEMSIQKGELFKFPIFGGLSQYLTKIIPGFGYSLQSDFTAPFTIANRRISSDEINLKGNMLTIAGRGNLNFDQELDFKVQVRLLKEGLVAEALQLITWPISKLLEFKLTGTTEEPDWRPDNLPKELFLQFD